MLLDLRDSFLRVLLRGPIETSRFHIRVFYVPASVTKHLVSERTVFQPTVLCCHSEPMELYLLAITIRGSPANPLILARPSADVGSTICSSGVLKGGSGQIINGLGYFILPITVVLHVQLDSFGFSWIPFAELDSTSLSTSEWVLCRLVWESIDGCIFWIKNMDIYTIKTRLKYIYIYVYIYVGMFRIDWRNWNTPRADFWHVAIFFAWLGQVRVLEKNSHIWRSYDVFVTFLKVWKIT